jgi:hypothetical protein
MSDERLPFEPETDKEIRERFPKALYPDVQTGAVVAGLVKRPGQLRKHVFDWRDGMRMIASVDADGVLRVVHISVSWNQQIKTEAAFKKAVNKVRERIQALVQRNVHPLDAQMSRAAIHYAFRTEDFEHVIAAGRL